MMGVTHLMSPKGQTRKFSAFTHGVRLALINGHALIEMPRQFRAGNDKGQKDDPEKCPNDHTRRLMIELPFYNQISQAIDRIELA